MDRIEIVVVGAGVVGLAVARELTGAGKEVLVLERNDRFGSETSSRNSEVIHAGIYYPKDSLKARSCIEGRRLLYAFCARHGIPHQRIGKLIVATGPEETADLQALYQNALNNGVEDLTFLSRDEIKKIEPQVEADCALFSAATGILDTHAFMKKLADMTLARGGSIAYRSQLIRMEKSGDGLQLCVREPSGEEYVFSCRTLVNCAGLSSDRVAALAGLAKPQYRLHYNKGDYFRLNPRKAGCVRHPVYPVPQRKGAGLGIHATPDLAGQVRLGPDDGYVKAISYDVDPRKASAFCESVRRFLPFITLSDLSPDTAGIRPKLQGPGELFRDFLVQEESGNGVPGLIDLIGIESPGLTASLSLARTVAALVS